MLIVDDNATNRHILAAQTESWGMLPRETELPAEALEWIRRGDPFDLAILDMQMPDMDGLALAARDPAAPRRAARCRSSCSPRSGGEETAVDFAAFLTKPIKPSQLYDALMAIFGAGAARAAFAGSSPTIGAERLPCGSWSPRTTP